MRVDTTLLMLSVLAICFHVQKDFDNRTHKGDKPQAPKDKGPSKGGYRYPKVDRQLLRTEGKI
jgi:hypothetical protein